MADLIMTAGILNIVKVFRDGLFLDLDFSVSLVDHQFAASVVNAVTKAETTITVEPVDIAAGKLQLKLSPANAAAIPVGKHTWSFRWTPTATGLTRTILAGTFEVRE